MGALQQLTARLDELVASGAEPAARAAGAARYLPDLLAQPGFLTEAHRAGSADGYTQHVVHVHPDGAYSVVALVWLPGQETPVHDHRCWCVVGVLQGAEQETRYHLVRHDGTQVLTVTETRSNPAGSVSVLVPPQENIHRVANACQGVAISMHVYGADIAVLGSSINKVFTEPVAETVPDGAVGVGWRAAAG